MDIITDLTARAVAYITVLQDIGKQDIDKVIDLSDKAAPVAQKGVKDDITDLQRKTIADIIWTSQSTASTEKKVDLFFHFSAYLAAWLKDNDIDVSNKTPYQLRNHIRQTLYNKPAERLSLVSALHYMPVQIIIALTYKNQLSSLSGYEQRLYQVWQTDEHSADILEDGEKDMNSSWWSQNAEDVSNNIKNNHERRITRHLLAIELIKNDQQLLYRLNAVEAAVPFETIFNEELNEIYKSRKVRFPTLSAKIKGHEQTAGENDDPMKRAQDMELYALAFSGGGIRSATFNLGILQKLSEKNILPRIDYLSTVSGGGYIGTWFASWIQRSGSVRKVAERLNHTKSGDPMAEEVRPIRWLRMFSNYLAPDAGIMSTDSWTMGMTWLRNTLINQTILFLALLTVLSLLDVTFYLWSFIFNIHGSFLLTDAWLWVFSAIVLLPGGYFAGLGMRSYYLKSPVQTKWRIWWNQWAPYALIGWAFLAAFFASARLITEHVILNNNGAVIKHYALSYRDSCIYLIPTSVFAFAGMLIAAYVGRYQRCADDDMETKGNAKAHFLIIISSLIAAAAGVFLLAGLWELLYCLERLPDPCFVSHKQVLDCCKPGIPVSRYIEKPKDIVLIHYGLRLVYVIGVPLIIELIACCVVIRMAIMGSLFPDERREWWGRLGAITHRISLTWMVIVSAVLILPYAMRYVVDNIELIKLLGGWGVIIGAGVKLAYSSTDTTNKQGGATGKIINTFILIVPYVFMLGFLLLGAYAINLLNTLCFGLQEHWLTSLDEKYTFVVPCAILFAVLFGVTLILGNRVGVNEFSLHHFYRNRLIRAYLGATRSRASRDKTVNKFTNFDNADDIKLKEFQTDNNYYGPLPIMNTALNSTKNQELDRQDRKAESFIFTPLYCGFDFSLTRSAATGVDQVYEYGYRPTNQYAYTKGPSIGTAMAISGAAVNPNWGYHSSPATAFLLTLFNVRLGWWIGNPRKPTWKRSDPRAGLLYLIYDFIGNADIDADYVCLSDGGHFDNMGLYELIRRRCRYIILGDGEEDDDSSFEGLANAMRRCRVDFGVELVFEPEEMLKMIPDKENSDIVKNTFIKGRIEYPGNIPDGKIIYIKTRITKDITADIRQYNMTHKDFPEQSTADQFFSEDQFESYRKLGYDSIDTDELEKFFSNDTKKKKTTNKPGGK